MTTQMTNASDNNRRNHAANSQEAIMANSFALGSVVVNFGTTAMVVGYFKAVGGPSAHDGSPILRALSADRRRFVGDRWVADPSKCEAAS